MGTLAATRIEAQAIQLHSSNLACVESFLAVYLWLEANISRIALFAFENIKFLYYKKKLLA